MPLKLTVTLTTNLSIGVYTNTKVIVTPTAVTLTAVHCIWYLHKPLSLAGSRDLVVDEP